MDSTNGVGGSNGATAAVWNAQVDAGSERPGDASSLLPDPGSATRFNGDVMTALAELLTKADQSDKKSARALENKANEAQAAADDRRIAEMRVKADADKAAGLVEGWGDIASGALTVGGGYCAAKDPQTTGGQFNGWAFGAKAFEGGAKVSTGVAKLISTNSKYDADQANIAATRAQNASQAAERSSKSAHEAVQDAREAMKKVAEFLEKMQQTANGSLQTAAAFRA